MTELRIPEQLLPTDGRFGSGPSLVRRAQIDDIVSRAVSVMGTSHRQQPVKQLVQHIREGLHEFYRLPDGYEVVLGNGGSTAFWDAAVFGLVRNRAQAAVFGEFGGKFAKAANTPWLQAPDIREAAPGDAALLEPLEGIDCYATPHNETSTGAMVPVTRVRDGDALTMIDATSAAGGIEVDLRECDVYYFAPQKNFGSDGGLWFAIMSPAAIERIEEIAASDRYIPSFLSLKKALDNSRKQQTLNTPAVASLSLFESQIRWMLEQGGLQAMDARTRASSTFLYDWADDREWITPFVTEEYRSQVVVTLDLDERIDGAKLRTILADHGIVDIAPYRSLGRNQLRIGTFAAVAQQDIEQLAASIDYVAERIAS